MNVDVYKATEETHWHRCYVFTRGGFNIKLLPVGSVPEEFGEIYLFKPNEIFKRGEVRKETGQVDWIINELEDAPFFVYQMERHLDTWWNR